PRRQALGHFTDQDEGWGRRVEPHRQRPPALILEVEQPGAATLADDEVVELQELGLLDDEARGEGMAELHRLAAATEAHPHKAVVGRGLDGKADDALRPGAGGEDLAREVERGQLDL